MVLPNLRVDHLDRSDNRLQPRPGLVCLAVGMPRYIAFLRAVNVGGRLVKMADLRTCLAESGLGEVETYIQTGNVRFTSSMRSSARVSEHVERVLGAACGFDVPTVVVTPAELRAVHDDALAMPSPLPGDPRRYVTFLKAEPTRDERAAIESGDFPGEASRVRGRAIHVWLTVPAHKAKSYNTKVSKSLVGTTRDLKVVATLSDRWGVPSDLRGGHRLRRPRPQDHLGPS